MRQYNFWNIMAEPEAHNWRARIYLATSANIKGVEKFGLSDSCEVGGG
jgi:hypothetical protein